MRLLKKALVMWLILLVVMFANGTVRVTVLQPRLGEDTARQVATVSGIALVLALSLVFVRRLDSPSSRELLQVGVLWLALTVVFEFGMGLVSGRSWDAMLADYDLRRGRLWPVALVVILLAPWFWGKAGMAGQESLARRRKIKALPPVELPTFRGSGLQPGVDLDDSAALQDRIDGHDAAD